MVVRVRGGDLPDLNGSCVGRRHGCIIVRAWWVVQQRVGGDRLWESARSSVATAENEEKES